MAIWCWCRKPLQELNVRLKVQPPKVSFKNYSVASESSTQRARKFRSSARRPRYWCQPVLGETPRLTLLESVLENSSRSPRAHDSNKTTITQIWMRRTPCLFYLCPLKHHVTVVLANKCSWIALTGSIDLELHTSSVGTPEPCGRLFRIKRGC